MKYRNEVQYNFTYDMSYTYNIKCNVDFFNNNEV